MESDLGRKPFMIHFGFMYDDADGPPIFLFSGGMTLIIDDDKNMGWSICSLGDRFDRKQGIELALKRLKENPERIETYNPDWVFDNKIDFAYSLADSVIQRNGPQRISECLYAVPRKQRYLNPFIEEKNKEWESSLFSEVEEGNAENIFSKLKKFFQFF